MKKKNSIAILFLLVCVGCVVVGIRSFNSCHERSFKKTIIIANKPSQQCKETAAGETKTAAPTKPVEIEIEITVNDDTEWEETENLAEDCEALARMLYGEARGLSKEEQAACVWCVLNRVDHQDYPNTIKGVITQPGQFTGYKESNPMLDELYDLAFDVVIRWKKEKAFSLPAEKSGRVLPKEYLYFFGDNGHNRFRKKYRSKKYWNWSLESPYKEQ